MTMFNLFRRPAPPPAPAPTYSTTNPVAKVQLVGSEVGTPLGAPGASIYRWIAHLTGLSPAPRTATAMDSMPSQGGPGGYTDGSEMSRTMQVSGELFDWFASKSFIGHQVAAIVAQQWLVQKACYMPPRDAVRNGYKLVGDFDDAIRARIESADKAFGIADQMATWLSMGRVFGVRIALFKVDYGDEAASREAYEAPFNPDGVAEGSYRGIVQIDPYWCMPALDAEAAQDPTSPHFYEPTWWIIGGKRYHRTHLVIYRHGLLADFLKPAYLYGGIPLPQIIMERVYGAERTTDEAPLLALTKRTMVLKTDTDQLVADMPAVQAKFAQMARLWNNTATRVIGTDDEHTQYDTSLADLDTVIMAQYQIVAAVANMPATKLLGTSPRGFGAAGDYEISSYHQELESLQTVMGHMLDRHHLLLARSMGLDATIGHEWNPLDVPTELDVANTASARANEFAALVNSGIVDGVEVRERLKQDATSGWQAVLRESDDAPPEE